MNYERPYYQDINYKPELFYIMFGGNPQDLELSKERHHVDEFPEGLDMVMYSRDNEEQKKYMESLFSGTLGKILRDSNPELFERASKEKVWTLIKGRVEKDNTLDYFRNVIGFIQALIERGAYGVLDLPIFNIMDANYWTEKIFDKEFNPFAHAIILISQDEDGTLWLHTRGMSKFGRPDISIRKLIEDNLDDAAALTDQMMYYAALGALFDKKTKLHTSKGKTYVINPRYIDDMNNNDFNNSYYEMNWDECIEEKAEQPNE